MPSFYSLQKYSVLGFDCWSSLGHRVWENNQFCAVQWISFSVSICLEATIRRAISTCLITYSMLLYDLISIQNVLSPKKSLGLCLFNLLTASQSDLEVMVWDIEKHVLKKTIQGLGQCTATFFCLNDKCIATEMEQAVRILVVETGMV